MTKKKIAIIGLKGLPAYGGASRAGESVIDLLKDDYDYTIYAVSSHTEHHGSYNGYEQYVFKSLKSKKLNIFLYYIKSALHCLFVRNYDLIQINHVESGFVAPLLRIRYKVVGTARGNSQNVDKWSKSDKKFFLLFEWLFLKFCNKIIAVAQPHIKRYQKITDKPVIHIPNGINTDEAYQSNVKWNDYLFFAAGRILGIKGCHTFLEALINIKYQGKILIAGDLEQVPLYRDEILRLASKLDVTFLGLIRDKKQLMGLLKNAKLFVFPSFIEGMSNMLLEAASMKVPIICSDIPENKAVFEEGEVTFFKTGDETDLSAKISSALSNNLLMSERASLAFKKLEDEYQWTTIAAQYKAVYDSFDY